jgi:hypothetical protein
LRGPHSRLRMAGVDLATLSRADMGDLRRGAHLVLLMAWLARPAVRRDLTGLAKGTVNCRSRFQRVLWRRPGLQFPRPSVRAHLPGQGTGCTPGAWFLSPAHRGDLRVFSTGSAGGRVLRPRRRGSSSACSRPAALRVRISSLSRRVTISAAPTKMAIAPELRTGPRALTGVWDQGPCQARPEAPTMKRW